MNLNGISSGKMNKQQNFKSAQPVIGLASEIKQITTALNKRGIPVETIPLSKVTKSAKNAVRTVLLTTGEQDTFYAKQLKALMGEVQVERGDMAEQIGEAFAITEPPIPASKFLADINAQSCNHLSFRTKAQNLDING